MKAELPLSLTQHPSIKRTIFGLVVFTILSVSLGTIGNVMDEVQAQGPTSCPALVEQALTELQSNCDELGRNSACYGYTLVDATFSEEVAPEFFSRPADIAGLSSLVTIQTAPLDVIADQWGIALMNAQANVPNTLPGQAVTFILMGDALVENRVPSEEALSAIEPIDITVRADSVLRSQPTRSSNAADIVIAETAIPADAVDATAEWVRVLYNNRAVWVAASEVLTTDVLSGLPVVTPETRSPMQAFYFSTGIGRPTCDEAPDVITIQGREDLVVDLSVNGAEVRIASMIHLRSIAADRVAFSVSQGHLEIVDTGETAETGETIEALLDETGSIIMWDAPRPWTPEEAALINVIRNALDRLENGGPLIHIVVRGETLFGIAQQYNTSMPEIVRVNSLPPNGAVRVGQRLLIPNPGSGFIALIIPPTATPLATASAVDCSTLRATSPLDGLAYGLNTFYWTPLAGATSYQVIVTNRDTGQVAFFPTIGQQTNLTALLDDATIGRGFNFTWSVQALFDSQPLCNSNVVALQRGSAPVGNPPPTAVPLATATAIPTIPPPPFTASWRCSSARVAEIAWSNAQSGEPITINFDADNGTGTATSPVTLFGTGPAGFVPYQGLFPISNGVVIGSVSGSVNLPGTLTC